MLHKFQENFTKGFAAYRRGMEDPRYIRCRVVRYLSDNSHARGYVTFLLSASTVCRDKNL